MNQQNKYPLDNPAKSSPQDRKKSPERILKEKQEKKEKRSINVGRIVSILEGIISAAFLITLFVVNILPFKYVGIFVILTIVLFLVTVKTQGKKGLHIAGKIVGIISGIAFAIGIYALIVLNMIFGAMANKEGSADSKVVENIFNVYVYDGEKDMVLTVNRDTHQIFEIATPKTYYAIIPNVSNGQKDTLENSRKYGVEATRAMLESIYEMKIPYVIEYNKEEMSGLFDELLVKMLFQPGSLVDGIDSNFETNLTKDQLRQLAKQYLDEDEGWKIYPVKAAGIITEKKTYTNPDVKAEVMEPNKDMLTKIIELQNRIEDGEKLTAEDLVIE